MHTSTQPTKEKKRKKLEYEHILKLEVKTGQHGLENRTRQFFNRKSSFRCKAFKIDQTSSELLLWAF